MADLNRFWQRVQGHTCENCRFSEFFRSNGDGQVTRVHLFCRCPTSPYHDRPTPPERWCEEWTAGGQKDAPKVGNPDLTV